MNNRDIKESVKEEFIRNFIKEKKRIPTFREINFYLNEFEAEESELYKKGSFLRSKDFYLVKEESSAEQTNTLQKRVLRDIESLDYRLGESIQELEDYFRTFNSSFDYFYNKLEDLNLKANRELLLNNSDIFNYGITENFSDYQKIDFDKSNTYLFNGRPTVALTRLVGKELPEINFTYSISARSAAIVERRNISSINNIYKEDGSFFQELVYTNSPDDIVDFKIDIFFSEGKEISKLKLITKAIETNSKMSVDVFYSKDETKYVNVFENHMRVVNNDNYFDINQKDVKRIRIILTKRCHDIITNNKYGYLFSLDFIGLVEAEYKVNEESELYLGPYEIISDDKPINFSMATMRYGTCCIVPDKTSVDFYLSKDNSSWQKCSFDGQGKEIIQFKDGNQFLFSDGNEVASDTDILLNIPFEIEEDKETVLKYYIRKEDKDKINLNSLQIRRNTKDSYDESIYRAAPGWYWEDGFYYTTFYIKELEGRYIDFGNRSAFVDNKLVENKVFLANGFHTFKTDEINWLNINNSFTTLRSIKGADNLYPYNHKYLIEGYPYPSTFDEEKVYLGAEDNFGWLMEKVSPELFEEQTSKKYFCLEEDRENLYIKIKVDSDNNYYQYENFDLSARTNDADGGNLLYIKAIMKTNDVKVTPKIDSIQVRVI